MRSLHGTPRNVPRRIRTAVLAAVLAAASCGVPGQSGQGASGSSSHSASGSATDSSVTKGSDPATVGGSATAGGSETAGAHESGQLSIPHRVRALAAAHQEADRSAEGGDDQQGSGWPSGISAVTVVVGPGTVTHSNTGHTCESGTIISVQLVGAFHTVTTGRFVYPTASSPSAPPPDTTVRELDLSVDAASGNICLIGARTEPTPPGPDDSVLYSP